MMMYKVVTLVLFIQEFILCLASEPSAKTYDVKPAMRYGVMLDLGSSGTKLRLYKWPKRLAETELPQLEDVYDNKFKPSLSRFADDVASIPGYLQPIIETAKNNIPEGMHSMTPIYAIATAGMRTLNSTWSRNVFNVVRAHLSNKTLCPFIFYPRQARISSGEEEGVFAWISLNYLKGTFSKHDPMASDFTGVLEMGGGSTQITFLPDGPIYAGKFPVQIAGKIYPLYTHSYLMYGQNYIVLRVNTHLVKESPGRSSLYNPCMLKGDTREFSGVRLIGSSDRVNCERLLSMFLKKAADDWCYPKPCAIGRTYQPSVIGKQFYAVAGFVYTPKDLGIGPTLIPDELHQKAVIYCNKTLEEATAQGIPSRFASTLCLMGLYIPKLLTEAYGFPLNSRAITASNTYGEHKISWAMGAMLYEIERLEFAGNTQFVESAPLPSCSVSAGHSLHPITSLHLAIALLSSYSVMKFMS